jgi:CBS domain-containing protein
LRYEIYAQSQEPRPVLANLLFSTPKYLKEAHMKVKHVMNAQVHLANPSQPIWEAAQTMLESDAGALPVWEGDRLVGMITDRDIAVRAVASRKSVDTTVGEVMTNQVLYCFEDDDVERVADNMSQQKVRRLPVVDRDKRLVGIVSVADLAEYDQIQTAGRATAEITQAGGPHSQGGH